MVEKSNTSSSVIKCDANVDWIVVLMEPFFEGQLDMAYACMLV